MVQFDFRAWWLISNVYEEAVWQALSPSDGSLFCLHTSQRLWLFLDGRASLQQLNGSRSHPLRSQVLLGQVASSPSSLCT